MCIKRDYCTNANTASIYLSHRHCSLSPLFLLFSRFPLFLCLAIVLPFLFLLITLLNRGDKILFTFLLLLVFLFTSLLFPLLSCGALFALLGEEVFAGLDLEVDFGFFWSGREWLCGC